MLKSLFWTKSESTFNITNGGALSLPSHLLDESERLSSERNSTTENVEINTIMVQRRARMEMKRQVHHVSYAMPGHTNAWCFVFSFVHLFIQLNSYKLGGLNKLY